MCAESSERSRRKVAVARVVLERGGVGDLHGEFEQTSGERFSEETETVPEISCWLRRTIPANCPRLSRSNWVSLLPGKSERKRLRSEGQSQFEVDRAFDAFIPALDQLAFHVERQARVRSVHRWTLRPDG